MSPPPRISFNRWQCLMMFSRDRPTASILRLLNSFISPSTMYCRPRKRLKGSAINTIMWEIKVKVLVYIVFYIVLWQLFTRLYKPHIGVVTVYTMLFLWTFTKTSLRRGIVIYWSYSMSKSIIPSQICPTYVILSIVHLLCDFKCKPIQESRPFFHKNWIFICPSARRACRPAEWKESVKLNSLLPIPNWLDF